MPNQNSIFMKDVEFSYGEGRADLAIGNFAVSQCEKVFIQGASGSGKSTLLGLIAGVLTVRAGETIVLGHSLEAMTAADRDALRADAIGVIFQQFNLVPFLSLIDNVLLPCRFSKTRASRTGSSASLREKAALDLLERLGLGAEAREGRTVSALSVGQQQRVAAARALIGAPSLIIADEPTSALDTASRDSFIETLLAEAKDASVLFVSHDHALAPRFDRAENMASINAAIAAPQEAA